MAINYARLFHRRATPQSEPIPGSAQVANSAGGYAWQVDDWIRLDRFLILGAEGGTYYIGERDLVKENHDALVRCIQADGVRAVNRIVEISDSGRAPKNDPAIFALALVAAHGDPAAKALAFQSLGKVCRIGTHLFHFAEYVNALRGWGRGLRNAVGRWYVSREAGDLALQVVKYQQRDRWSHGDMLRLAHPTAPSRDHEAVFRWILSGADGLGERTVTRRVKGEPRVAKYAAAGELPALIVAFEQAKKASTKAEIVKLIAEHDLPREAVPTQWLNEPEVWDALLQRMPMTAMIRNLGKMTSLGLVQPFSDAAKLVVNKLSDEKVLQRARIHPLAVLIAQKVYAQGHGEKGGLKWPPVARIVDALDAAFYATFRNVEPCGKPVLLALDVSGSMDGSRIAGSCLTAREASAAMALVTAATEPDCEIIAFSAPAGGGYGGMHGGGESGITRVALSPRMRLDDVIKRVSAIPMGGTDCALPMIWARRQKLNVSGFITYTDSETWAGNIHPAQALRLYRDEYVSDAKAVVVGMTANGFTLADPNDRGMLDVVGFDATVPAVIADFVRA
jgi:60 kDa SS-A/Ro ribonucleoprotein